MWHRMLLLAIALGLVACSSEPPPAPPPAQADAPAPGVLDDQIKAIDKAKAAADQELERQRKMDEQLDGG